MLFAEIMILTCHYYMVEIIKSNFSSKILVALVKVIFHMPLLKNIWRKDLKVLFGCGILCC